MKKIAVLAGLLMVIQGAQLNAWGFFDSSSSEESSSSAEVKSPEGGTVIIGGQAYKTEPGQTLQVSGGGVNAQMNTVQEAGKEPVTTMDIEESEPVVKIDGKTAQPIAAEEADVDAEESNETPEEKFQKALMEAEMEADLDFGDGYES